MRSKMINIPIYFMSLLMIFYYHVRKTRNQIKQIILGRFYGKEEIPSYSLG